VCFENIFTILRFPATELGIQLKHYICERTWKYIEENGGNCKLDNQRASSGWCGCGDGGRGLWAGCSGWAMPGGRGSL